MELFLKSIFNRFSIICQLVIYLQYLASIVWSEFNTFFTSFMSFYWSIVVHEKVVSHWNWESVASHFNWLTKERMILLERGNADTDSILQEQKWVGSA